MYDWDDIDEFFDNDFAPEKATFDGVEYSAIRYSSDKENKTFDAGYDTSVNFQLMLKVADFASVTAPAPDDEITYGGITYRIASIDTDSNGKTYLLSLKEYNA